jgi:GTPase SAR1 family protein
LYFGVCTNLINSSYDITNTKSFENIKNWAQELSTHSTYNDIVKLLVGNKLDLVKNS